MKNNTNFNDIPFSDDEIAACPIADSEETESAMHRRGARSGLADSVSGENEREGMPSITPLTQAQLLNYGVDSLYLSFRGNLKPSFINLLQTRKEYAADTRTESRAQIFVAGAIFKVEAYGTKRFKYIISNDDFNIQLNGRSGLSKMPFATAQISSEYLAKHTIAEALANLGSILDELGDVLDKEKISSDVVLYNPNVSRIDLFCDITADFDFSKLEMDDFLTRAGKFVKYVDNDQFTGLTIGMKGGLGFRLYNKTIEINKSDKFFFHNIWEQAGWDKEKPIFRFEFQVRRPELSKFKFSSFNEIAGREGSLWNHLTQDWLRMVVPNYNDSHKSRWETHWLWEFIQGIYKHNYKPLRFIVKTVTTFEKRKLIIFRFYKTSITDFMACFGYDDIEEAHKKLLSAFMDSYACEISEDDENGYIPARKDYQADVLQTVARKRRNFNLLNSTTALTPPDYEPIPDCEYVDF